MATIRSKKGGDSVSKKRSKKKHRASQSGSNKHHILWQRRYWNSGYLKALREHEYLVVEVPVSTLHHQIHAEMSGIPVVRPRSAKMVLDELNRLQSVGAIRLDEPISKRLGLLIFMLEGIEPQTVKALKKQLKIVTSFEQRET